MTFTSWSGFSRGLPWLPSEEDAARLAVRCRSPFLQNISLLVMHRAGDRASAGRVAPGNPLSNRNQAQLRAWFAEAPLYAILDTSLLGKASSLEVLEALLRAGVKVIQYRHKGQFRRANFEECSRLAQKAAEGGGALLVNDRADIADLSGAAGVHLGQDDLPVEWARELLGPARYIGYSSHNLEQARLAETSSADYIAIGPVFATSTKKNPEPVVGLETVAQVRSVVTKPLVAIGGITLENAVAVLKAGADAVAVIRGLLEAPDVEARARQFLSALKT